MKKMILFIFSFFLLNYSVSAASYLVPSTCSSGTKTLVSGKYYCLTNGEKQTITKSCDGDLYDYNTTDHYFDFKCCESPSVYIESENKCAYQTGEYMQENSCTYGDYLIEHLEVPISATETKHMFRCCDGSIYSNNICYKSTDFEIYNGACGNSEMVVSLNKQDNTVTLECCIYGAVNVNGSCKIKNNPTCSNGTLTSNQNNCEIEDNVTPTVNITAKKVSSNTAVASDTYSNEGLKFTLTKGTVGESGYIIYYCKDTNNTCNPSIEGTHGLAITDYTDVVGTYYIRYKIVSGAGLSSEVSYYKAKVDTTSPTVSIVAKKEISNTVVNSGQFTDEGLYFTLTQGTVGVSGATIYYCKDTANTCTPTIEVSSGTVINEYIDAVDTYYIRYKITSGAGKSSTVASFKAMVDKTIPFVIIGAKKVTSNTYVNSGVLSDEGLKFIFTQGTVGVSGAAVYYCKDTNDTCTPTIQVTSGAVLTDFSTTNGIYYIRYKITNGLGKTSDVASYKAMVDIGTPDVTIEAKKSSSNTSVSSNTYSDEGLKYIFNGVNVGASGATIYYCKDTTNTCTPSTEVTEGSPITNFTSVTGTYYIRYKITSGVGKSSDVASYKARVDTTTPTVTLVAKTVNSNTTVTSEQSTDEGLKFTLTYGTVGSSGAYIYYCKDLNNTCNPEVSATSGTAITDFTAENGVYYLRYKIVSGAGKSSDIYSFKAVIDFGTPTVTINAKKVNKGTSVRSGGYSDEGLKYTFTAGNVGASGATIYYCKDTNNTCTPSTNINSGVTLTNYASEAGTYYLRYKITSGSGKSSNTESYKAIVDLGTPSVSIVAKKSSSNTVVNSGNYSNETLNFVLTSSNVGVSGATIYYCKDTDNTCSPGTPVTSGEELTTFNNVTGTYYIRYKVTSGAGKSSNTLSYKAMVDTNIPTVSIVANKVISGTVVENNAYSDEGLVFAFSLDNVGASGATIYYCKDTNNTCEPSIEVAHDLTIATYSSEKGIYYIRYRIVDGTGRTSPASSYKATIDDVIPSVSIVAKKVKSDDEVASGVLSDEGLKFSFTIDTIGLSGGTIYYCKDTTNTCNPTNKINNDTILSDYINLNGNYYLRYVIMSGTGKIDRINSYEAKVELPNAQIDYEFIYGENQVVNSTKVEEVVFKIDGEKEKLVDIYLNGELVSPDNYTITSGSTVVTFKNTFISKLNNGKYTLTAVYTDGEAQTTFVVNNAEIDNPHTGAFLTISLIGLGIIGCFLLLKNKKKLYRF